jgi:hypothetical protein
MTFCDEETSQELDEDRRQVGQVSHHLKLHECGAGLIDGLGQPVGHAPQWFLERGEDDKEVHGREVGPHELVVPGAKIREIERVVAVGCAKLVLGDNVNRDGADASVQVGAAAGLGVLLDTIAQLGHFGLDQLLLLEHGSA